MKKITFKRISFIGFAVMVAALFIPLLYIETSAVQLANNKSIRQNEEVVIVDEKIIKDEPTATTATMPVNDNIVAATYVLAITAILGGCAFFVFAWQNKKEKEIICGDKQME